MQLEHTEVKVCSSPGWLNLGRHLDDELAERESAMLDSRNGSLPKQTTVSKEEASWVETVLQGARLS